MSSVGFLDDRSHRVTHFTSAAHWCPGCWSWVVDCEHMVDRLSGRRRSVKDPWIRTLNYYCGRLEVEFTWLADIRQFYPVTPELFRQILYSKLPKSLLETQVMDAKGVWCSYVRHEAQQLAVLVKCAEITGAFSRHSSIR